MRHNADVALILLNAALVLRAIYYNATEARDGFRQWRRLRTAVAVLGGVYLCSYAVILSGQVDRLLWSQVMVGVSPLVWEVVWTGPARTSRKIRRQIVEEGIASLEERRRAA